MKATRLIPVCALLGSTLLTAQDPKPAAPARIQIGNFRFRPSGFFEYVEMFRTATTADSISTRFGRIPLTDTPSQWLGTHRHTRTMLRMDGTCQQLKISGYLESDFMDFRSGASPHRWRHYWGQVTAGNWEFLGGQSWSLLRANRKGIAPDKDILTPWAIEPNHNVGFTGSRLPQLRLTRIFGRNYKAAIAWEQSGNRIAKLAWDRAAAHLEVAAVSGSSRRLGVLLAGSAPVSSRHRIVTQQFFASRNLDEALGVVPAGRSGFATLLGLETSVNRTFEVYAYAGLVAAARAAENRMIRQWTLGFNQKLPGLNGVTLSSQFSHLDRSTWEARSNSMSYLMMRMRYSVN